MIITSQTSFKFHSIKSQIPISKKNQVFEKGYAFHKETKVQFLRSLQIAYTFQDKSYTISCQHYKETHFHKIKNDLIGHYTSSTMFFVILKNYVFL